MEHAENQARRYRDRRLEGKRLPKEEKVLTAPPVARPKARAAQPEPTEGEQAGARAKARASIAVHSFPSRATVVEPHILKSGEAIALKPMTIEEAVKEAEFRDRDLLIFRNACGRDVCAASPPRRADGAGGDALSGVSGKRGSRPAAVNFGCTHPRFRGWWICSHRAYDSCRNAALPAGC